MGSNSLSRLLDDGDALSIVQVKRQGKTLRLISGDSTLVTSKSRLCKSLTARAFEHFRSLLIKPADRTPWRVCYSIVSTDTVLRISWERT